MTLRKLRVVALAFLLSTNALAGSMATDTDFGNGNFVATLSLGPGWARPGQQNVLTLTADVQKSYVPLPTRRTLKLVSTANGTDGLIAGEVFAGLRGAINSVVEGQLGLALGASSQVKLKGSVYEDTNPAFNNFSYSYGVRNTRLALKAKFLYDIDFFDLFPYLSGSAGLSYNHTSGFTIKPKIIEEVAAPIFSNKNETEFSYSIGIGLETALDSNWRLALGYEFVDWGRSALGSALGQTIGNTGPRLANMRAQELLISLSYVA